MKRRFKLGELFCGPGGMAIASTKVGPVAPRCTKGDPFAINHVWGVDFAPYAIETFNANLGHGECLDAWEFVKTRLDEAHRIDALAFGFPCNSFSAVGEQQGFQNEKFGKLYQTGIAVINRYDPVWFIAENVSGIKSVEGGHQFEQILTDLANAGTHGYDVTAHLYKFEEYGVPQSRHRYVIVGIRHDIAEKEHLVFHVPAPTHGPRGERPYVTCREAINARLAELGLAADPRNAAELPRMSERVTERMQFIAPGENAWTLDKLEQHSDADLQSYLEKLPWCETEIRPRFTASDGTLDLAAIRGKIAAVKLKCKSARMSHIYRRLDPDRPSYTLTGSGGGGTHIYHWAEHRALTNTERAALQSFPPEFKFRGTSEQIRKQIGMAVPTAGAVQIFRAILKTFANVDYPFIDDPSDYRFYPKGVAPDLKLTSD